MWLFAGLGNPGRDHEANRHNIGFMAVEAVVARHGFGQWRRGRAGCLMAEGSVKGLGGESRQLAIKPLSYMNLSGVAVGAVAQFYKIPTPEIIVFHDDLDLMPGAVRVKRGGGHGGHNGLRSLDQHVGPDYWRVRLGIGHPGDKSRVTGHVLGDFTMAERDWVAAVTRAVADAIGLLLSGNAPGFMAEVRKQAPLPVEGAAHA